MENINCFTATENFNSKVTSTYTISLLCQELYAHLHLRKKKKPFLYYLVSKTALGVYFPKFLKNIIWLRGLN